MGLFGGGNSSSESSTTAQTPSGTQYQAGSTGYTTGLVLNVAAKGKGQKNTTVSLLDANAVNQAIALAQDSAARAVAVTTAAIGELAAERAALVDAVNAMPSYSSAPADLLPAPAPAAEAAPAAAEPAPSWPLWIGAAAAAYYLLV